MHSATKIVAAAIVLAVLITASSYGLNENLEITGDVRIRLRYIDSKNPGALQGTYGELLTRGFSLRHRFVVEAAYPVASDLTVGGMIRVSNEDDEVLEAGPEYLSSDMGSAFIAYETPALISRLGYYKVAYTPLSLMRWDDKDDPEGGGCAVCPGTPGVGGVILGETLEELGPDLTFEGGKLEFSPDEAIALHTFFARPRTAGDDYQILTFGGRASFSRYLRRASSLLDISVMALRSREDTKSFEGEPPLDPEPFENNIYGIAWRVPVLKWLSLDGEWTTTEFHDLDPATGLPRDKKGRGGIASLSLAVKEHLNIEASYIYLSPNWNSYFRALSYNPDREGMRIRLEFNRESLLVAVFAKYLRTVEALPNDPDRRLTYPTFSARGYLRVGPDVNLGAAAIYSGEGSTEDVVDLSTDTERISYIATLTYEFGKDSSLTLEERYIRNQTDADDYDISYLSLYVRAAIW